MSQQELNDLYDGRVRFWTGSLPVEDAALKQLSNITQLPILAGHIAVIDEIPGAYKSIDEVMAAQTDLVEVRHTLKQVLCIKG